MNRKFKDTIGEKIARSIYITSDHDETFANAIKKARKALV